MYQCIYCQAKRPQAQQSALVAVLPQELERVEVCAAWVLQEARLVGHGGVATQDAVRVARHLRMPNIGVSLTGCWSKESMQL